MAESRESIWSVSESERRWYSALFFITLTISVLFYALYVIPWHEGTLKGVGILLLSFGALGVSSAILSMTLVAGGSFMVISFDWLHDKVKERRAAREAEMEERRATRESEMKAMREQWIEEGRRMEREEQRKREAQNEDAESEQQA